MKFVFKDFKSSYDYLHGKVVFIALHVHWLKCVPIAIETYKIIYGNGPVYIYKRFYRSGGKFFVIDTITAKIWNSIPNALGTTCDINVLKILNYPTINPPFSNLPFKIPTKGGGPGDISLVLLFMVTISQILNMYFTLLFVYCFKMRISIVWYFIIVVQKPKIICLTC